MCPRFPALLPLPLLTLRLASDNLLDCDLTDARGTPAFVLETEANITTLSRRCDGQLSASIEWPLAQPLSPKAKEEPVATVSIDGRTEPSDLLLKKSIMGNSRKFHLPGNTATLRWKRVGDHYQCSLCSLACTCHTPVATLQLSTPTTPGELSVFSAAANADSRPSQHSTGVSIRLLEYLIITSVLLTTAHDDWRRFPNAPDFSSPPLSSTRSLRQRLSPPSSPTASVSTNLASPTRRKLDLLEGDSDPFYCSSPTSTHTQYTTRSLTRSRSSNYLRPAALYSTPFSTPPSTPPIAYHELPTINPPVRPLPTTPPLADSARHATASPASPTPPVPPIPQHFLFTSPEEAPPSYAEIEWTVKVPQKPRASRREREQGSLLA